MAKARKTLKKVGFLHCKKDGQGRAYLEGKTIDNHTVYIFPNRQKQNPSDPDFTVMMPTDEADILFASHGYQGVDPFNDEVEPMGAGVSEGPKPKPASGYQWAWEDEGFGQTVEDWVRRVKEAKKTEESDESKRKRERNAWEETLRRAQAAAEEARRRNQKNWGVDPSDWEGAPGFKGPPKPPPAPPPKNPHVNPPYTPPPPPQDKWRALPNAFRTLEVDAPFEVEQIKTAWRKAAIKHHPDKGGKAEDFRRMRDAYEQCMAYRGAPV